MIEDKEVQFAEVRIRVALPVGIEDSEEARQQAICRKLRLADYPDGMELRPGLFPDLVELAETETMEEAAERKMAEAEARHEAEQQRRLERHWDNHGHY